MRPAGERRRVRGLQHVISGARTPERSPSALRPSVLFPSQRNDPPLVEPDNSPDSLLRSRKETPRCHTEDGPTEAEDSLHSNQCGPMETGEVTGLWSVEELRVLYEDLQNGLSFAQRPWQVIGMSPLSLFPLSTSVDIHTPRCVYSALLYAGDISASIWVCARLLVILRQFVVSQYLIHS